MYKISIKKIKRLSSLGYADIRLYITRKFSYLSKIFYKYKYYKQITIMFVISLWTVSLFISYLYGKNSVTELVEINNTILPKTSPVNTIKSVIGNVTYVDNEKITLIDFSQKSYDFEINPRIKIYSPDTQIKSVKDIKIDDKLIIEYVGVNTTKTITFIYD